jgi:hypothetical protein
VGNGRRLRPPPSTRAYAGARAAAKAALPRCCACGGRIGALRDRIELADRRLVCTRCVGNGVLLKKLPCGHWAMPGTMVISDSADLSNFACIRCSPHANLPAGYART